MRLGIIAAATSLLLGLAVLAYDGNPLASAVFGVSILSLGVMQKHRHRRMLVLRSTDLFTVGAEIDSAIAWSELDRIEAAGLGVDLCRRNGDRVHLALRFLTPRQRLHTIQWMLRYLEVFRLHGPLRLPPGNDAGIRSNRLVLTPVTGRDVGFITALMMAEDRHDNQLSVRTSRELVEHSFAEAHAVPGDETSWEYVIVKDGIPIGTLNARMSDLILRQAEVGVELLAAFRNQGFGTEALGALIEHFRVTSNILKITAGCFADNIGSRRLLEKCGMAFRGTLSRFWLKGTEWKDGVIYELVFSDERLPQRIEPDQTS